MSKKGIVLICILVLILGLASGAGGCYAYLNQDILPATVRQWFGLAEKTPEKAPEDTLTEDEQSSPETDDTNQSAQEDSNSPLQTPEDAHTTASALKMDVSEIVDKCLPCVVAITNVGETEVRSMWGNFTQETNSSGSGVIIGQTDAELLVLTNYHVVEGSEQLSVVFSWEENQETPDQKNIITAQIKDYDSARDIAVIAIDLNSLEQVTMEHITVASIGNSEDLKLGEQVVAIGNALGYGQSVTTGIVSALNRTVEGAGEIGSANKYIQTDAAINPGNSGGALFNLNGELVGINSAKIATNAVEGMGYAIPISTIMENVEVMMNSETRSVLPEDKRGVLGISCIDVTAQISQSYGMPAGVYISDTTPHAGAANAGLKKGDIITAINQKPVSDTTSLKRYLSYYPAGEVVTITVSRQSDEGYVSSDIPVTLSPASVNSELEEQLQEEGSGNMPKEPDNRTPTQPSDPFYDFFNHFGFGFGY